MLGNTELDQLKRTLRASIDHNEIAGANLMIVKDGQEIFYHEDGLADREAGLPIQRDSIFRMYSMTKPVTAAAVMILMERGQIDLFEPVSRYLQGFCNQMVGIGDQLVPVKREMSVKDLLSMTSGLVYGGYDRAGRETEELLQEIESRMLGESPLGTVEAMNRLGQCALQFHPGETWAYGTSADVLGAVVEAVSGKRYGEFLREELFEPLGMKDTGFWLPEAKRDRLAKVYADDGQGGLALFNGNHLGVSHQMDRDPAFESGGAGLVSTIDDYAQFAKMLLNQGSLGDVQILRPATVDYLTSSELNAEQQQSFNEWHEMSGHSYGNLMRVMSDRSQAGILCSPGEYGWDGWLGCYFANCPREDLTFLFMMQKKDSGTTVITRKLRNIVLSSCH